MKDKGQHGGIVWEAAAYSASWSPIQLPDNVLWKAAADGQEAWVPALLWETERSSWPLTSWPDPALAMWPFEE